MCDTVTEEDERQRAQGREKREAELQSTKEDVSLCDSSSISACL